MVLATVPANVFGDPLPTHDYNVESCGDARDGIVATVKRILREAGNTIVYIAYGHTVAAHSWVLHTMEYSNFEEGILDTIEKYIYYYKPDKCDDGDKGSENVSYSLNMDGKTWEKVENKTSDGEEITSETDFMQIAILIGIIIVVLSVIYVVGPSVFAGGGGGGGSCLLQRLIANLGGMLFCG